MGVIFRGGSRLERGRGAGSAPLWGAARRSCKGRSRAFKMFASRAELVPLLENSKSSSSAGSDSGEETACPEYKKPLVVRQSRVVVKKSSYVRPVCLQKFWSRFRLCSSEGSCTPVEQGQPCAPHPALYYASPERRSARASSTRARLEKRLAAPQACGEEIRRRKHLVSDSEKDGQARADIRVELRARDAAAEGSGSADARRSNKLTSTTTTTRTAKGDAPSTTTAEAGTRFVNEAMFRESQSEENEMRALQMRKVMVKRIFEMQSLMPIETHEQLWSIMKRKAGWHRREVGTGFVDYMLLSATNRCSAKARLPAELHTATLTMMENFAATVNKMEHDECFAVWATFTSKQKAMYGFESGSSSSDSRTDSKAAESQERLDSTANTRGSGSATKATAQASSSRGSGSGARVPAEGPKVRKTDSGTRITVETLNKRGTQHLVELRRRSKDNIDAEQVN